MASLFISYSRKDIDAARKLTEAFKGQELDFWIDWEGIAPTVDWWKEIERGIEEADIFLFLLSPDSCASGVCKREIEHAVKNGKRLIPVVVRDVKADASPMEFRHLNWVFIRESDDFDASFRKLITAIKTDYVWTQVHRELQVKALEWERRNHENSFLLRGKELQDAELQLVANASQEPHPTDLQREYVLRSRQSSDRQRRITLGVAIAGVIALAVLAIFGFVQAGLATTNARKEQAASTLAFSNANTAEAASTLAVSNANTAEANQNLAEERATLARAGELAAQSVSFRASQFDLSLLFSIEAFRTADTPRTKGVLLQNLQTNSQLLQYLYTDTFVVSSVAFSPKGTMLASGSDDGTVILWDVETRQPIIRLFQHTNPIDQVTFSPDGKILAAADHGTNIIFLWNVDTREEIGQIYDREHDDYVHGVAFSPDGKLIVTSGLDKTVILWDVETRQPIDKLSGPTNLSSLIAYSPDGRTLAAVSSNNTILLWDVTSHQYIGELTGHADSIWTLAFSPDGRMLASGGMDSTVILWDLETRQPIDRLKEHTSSVTALAFHPDGKMLVSGSSDGTIIVWNVETRTPIGEPLTEQRDWTESIAFSPDGTTLATSHNEIILLWNMASSQTIGQLLGTHTKSVDSIDFSPNGKILASGGADGDIILWDVENRELIGQFATQMVSIKTESLEITVPAQIESVAFSPDGKILVSAACRDRDENHLCLQGQILIWDVESRKSIGKPLTGHTNDISSLDFSPDGKMLASGSYDNTIILWDMETHQIISRLAGHTSEVYSVAFSPDGTMLASGTTDNIILWDLSTGQFDDHPTEHVDFGIQVTFSPDGKLLASGGLDNILLWDVSNGQTIGRLPGPFNGLVYSLAFSPDGTTLASGNSDSIIFLWDVASRQSFGQLTGHTGGVHSLDFSPDAVTLASAGRDNTILLWELKPQSWIEKTCQQVGRNITRAEWAQYFFNEEYRLTCPQWSAGE